MQEIFLELAISGSGFIGTRFCKRLQFQSSAFSIQDKAPSLTFPDQAVLADVRNLESLRAAIPENSVLINLAAEHRDDVRPLSLYDDVNVGGAENICTVAREKGVQKIIFTSTVAVYGFAAPNTDETGRINYFNDYGRTKWLAEGVFRKWQEEDPANRSLVIIRPTVVFGEQNRGNVYNLLRQISSGRFVMIGSGRNRKSMAYVENIAAFLEYSLGFGPGVHVDKPDFDMNTLVSRVLKKLGSGSGVGLRLPYTLGMMAGLAFDLLARITGKTFPISSIRVKKFCATTQFDTAIMKSGFVPPCSLHEGLERTLHYEFLEDNRDAAVFFTE
jgi:nucleoside-diphosphate-sugar epimerase